MLYNLIKHYSGELDDLGLFKIFRVLYESQFRAFSAVVVSFLIVLLLGKRVIGWLIKQKVGDAPEFYNADVNKLMASKAATPTMGGILICGSILVTTLLFADLFNTYVHLAMIVLIWLAAVGSVDDWLKLTARRRNPGSREGLYAWEKLLFQLGIGVIAGYFLYREGANDSAAHVLTLPFQRTYKPQLEPLRLEAGVIVLPMIAYVLISTLAIAGTSNAVNLTDGMDGLASGTMAIASFTMLVLCFIASNTAASAFLMFPYIGGAQELMVVTGAMAGACLGFLWFNCAPAKVFMGDTGSLALGGLLAYTAVAIRQEILLLVIGGVFFMEMMSVVMQVAYFKSTGGKRIFRCSPIHHHFHLGGWSETQVVTRFWLVAIVCSMIALVSLKLR
ncbi:MAG TPA: phospho-N-acetylmuramoyl-pentapeptide-transferase [Phycisphaerales bacterium]|nr:phospho-N-acetylmuramoyl-pentapeptide-transferase [Phycisphaerales bacterium]